MKVKSKCILCSLNFIGKREGKKIYEYIILLSQIK